MLQTFCRVDAANISKGGCKDFKLRYHQKNVLLGGCKHFAWLMLQIFGGGWGAVNILKLQNYDYKKSLKKNLLDAANFLRHTHAIKKY